MSKNQSDNGTRLIPVAKFNQYHPWPTPQSIRNRINRAKRGHDIDFLTCIRRVGGRLLVDENKFIEWTESHDELGAA